MIPVFLGSDQAAAQWLGAQLGIPFSPPYEIIGVLDDEGTLCGGVVLTDQTLCDVSITVYGSACCTRRLFRFVAQWVFVEHRLERITARVRRSNRTVRQLMARLGFVQEGVQRRYWGPTAFHDAILYGMLRGDCPWLPKGRDNERAETGPGRAASCGSGEGQQRNRHHAI